VGWTYTEKECLCHRETGFELEFAGQHRRRPSTSWRRTEVGAQIVGKTWREVRRPGLLVLLCGGSLL